MATLRERIAHFLAPAPKAETATPVPGQQDVAQAQQTKETAWSFPSLIYARADFPRYNPDDLIRGKGAAIYKRMMLDEQVKACMKLRRDAISSRDYYFELKDCALADDAKDEAQQQLEKKRADKKAKQFAPGVVPPKFAAGEDGPDAVPSPATDEIERRVKIMTQAVREMKGSFADALNGVLSAEYNGFSITEPVLQPFEYDGAQYWGLADLKLRPYDTFLFTCDEYGNVVKFQQQYGGNWKTLNLDDFIHYVVNPDVDPHYGQSNLREAYRAYFSKDNIIKFRNIWLERHAGGARWIQSAKEGGASLQPNSPDYLAVQNMLINWQTSTGAIVPRGLELMMQYPANNVAYKEAIDDCDMQIARSQLVPNLLGVSPQGQHGSLAQADTQLEAFFWTLDADAERLEDLLNEQLFAKIGELNFPDGDVPQFKFKPVSDAKVMKIAEAWSNLVGKSAVQATDTDEKHLRELMGFPEAGEPNQQPAMTGGVDANGNPINADGTPGIGAQDGGAGAGTKGAGANAKGGKPGADKTAETVTGHRVSLPTDEQKRAARLTASRRVDFAVIKRRAEDGIMPAAHALGRVMGEAVLDVFKTIEANNLVQDGKQDVVAKLTLDAKLKAKMRRVVTGTLRDAWSVGLKHASTELDKAKGSHFSRNVDAERVALIGAEHFDAKSFVVTGKLTDDAQAKIKQIVLSGVKNGRSVKQVEDEIIDTFAKDGMLSREDVLDYFAEATDYSNPQARLETIIRTSSFEAINEARYAYFTDPALDGFVQALEYSAILDDRTTDICEALDGHVHPADDAFWSTYTPPNHFNCRSLIIPITERDTWTETEDNGNLPQPQKGFG